MTKKISIRLFEDEKYSEENWNKFVRLANGQTIFHRIDFLNYHGSKFKDKEKHLLIFKNDTVIGIMPCAIFNGEEKKAFSPYGGSFGGPLFNNLLSYDDFFHVSDAIRQKMIDMEVKKLFLTLPTCINYQNLSKTFEFTLQEVGFNLFKRDISNVVHLKKTTSELESNFSGSNRNKIKNAQKKYQFKINNDDKAQTFWKILLKNFTKHGVKPTHTLEDLILLKKKFPKEIYFDIIYHDNIPISGICNFILNKRVNSAFYLANDQDFLKIPALNYLLYNRILKSHECGFDYYDFGTSSINEVSNPSLIQFKESFGAFGIFKDTYLLSV